MTRGPLPYDTFREAAKIAARRGTLKWFHRTDGDSSHFAIFGIDFVSLVGIRRARRLWAGPEEICREFHDTIARLKTAVLTSHVVRELWLCSYHGTWRFFQIVGWDLSELDREGRPVDGPCIAPSGKRA
ncbi:MAG: hypothetical protein EHM53_10205 [Methanoregulaceae archaeon]|nr:MAG: hypothetical protein EHM53_10205 [Methanoregulaceae archaeon]